jgi:hypothetical protein
VRKSFRQAGLGVGVLGTHAATWLTAPNLGEIIVLVEIALTAAVIITAIYGPDKYSSRAFRLLPWTASAGSWVPAQDAVGAGILDGAAAKPAYVLSLGPARLAQGAAGRAGSRCRRRHLPDH